MKNILNDWLTTYFDEVEPMTFYRSIFPAGELEEAGVFETGKYNAICVCVSKTEERPAKRDMKQGNEIIKIPVFNEDGTPKMESKIYRYNVADDLGVIEKLQHRPDLFCLMSPLSYAGKSRTAENSRFMYAMAFDLDFIRVVDEKPIGLMDLWNGHIMRAERIPKPTYIVFSGTGLHLYYVFKEPIPLFANIVKQLQALKHELTEMMWNEGIVNIKSDKDIQYEGIYQGFRLVGTTTKKDDIARAYETGEKVTIEYLNGFVREAYRVIEFTYKSKLTKAQAKEKYPEWFEYKIVQGNKGIRKPWKLNRSVYDWWKREILRKATVGHRYYCLMILSIYAKKCSFYDEKKNPNPVTYEELEQDAFEIMTFFDTLKDNNNNNQSFDESDVLKSLEAYEDGLLTYPKGSIQYKSGITIIPSVKRKDRPQKQEWHLEDCRNKKVSMKKRGEEFKNAEGRPKGSGEKKEIVEEWQEKNPKSTKADCQRETGLDPKTIRKWWE